MGKGWAQPVITTQPASQAASLSSTVTFSVAASSSNPPISYQWQFDGTAIDLATNSTLTLSDVTSSQAGTYTVYVYDSVGGVTSVPAALTLTGGPVINSTLNAAGYSQTIPFLYTITATNSPTSFGATGLPPGLSVNAQTGVISGIPTAIGTFQVALTASNSSGSNSATLSLAIGPTPYCFSNIAIVQTVPFSNAAGIVYGGPNLFYVVDTGNSTIYQFNPATQTATVWAGTTGVTGSSDGDGVAATFNNPTGVAVDSSGNVYVADTANSTIRKITSSGSVTTLAGVSGEPGAADGAASAAHFNYPQGVAVDPSGNVYVADTGNQTIREISTSGMVTTIAGQGLLGRFTKPIAIVVDSKGNLFVGDAGVNDYFVYKISTAGTLTKFADDYNGGFTQPPPNLAIDASDNLYLGVSDLRFTQLTEVTPAGISYEVGPLSTTGENYQILPIGIAFDPSGHMFATLGDGIDEGFRASGPTINSQPEPVTVDAGQTAAFAVAASAFPDENENGNGESALSYQWLLNGAAISGATGSSYTTVAGAATAGSYSVVITAYGGGAILSNAAELAVLPAPVISTPPASQAVAPGMSATFSVVASGSVSPTYQWTYNGTPIAGATNTSYSISNAQVSGSGAYAVVLTYGGVTETSQSAFLTVAGSTGAPSIAVQPQSCTLVPNGTVALNVALALGQGTATYQWYENGVALSDGNGTSGSQSPTLVLSGAATQSGSYVCLVENTSGSVLSTPAMVTLSQTTDMGRLINVSCRATVGTGANILIAGYIVGGSGTSGSESVLIRGAGPALVPFDVPETLPDPELELFSTASGSNLLGTNDGWGGNSLVASTAASVGAFPWNDLSSLDAAFLALLAPGPYTANIAGKSGDSGVALAEVYDATPEGTYTPTTPRLVNISARVQVGTGGAILIAGFIIGGSTSETVLIRASGPALAPLGVNGVLPDPQLQLFSGSNVIQSNTGWGGNPQISSAASSVGAFAWSSNSSKDSAILVTLPPGPYTAQVSGVSGDTGVALVEVYEVP